MRAVVLVGGFGTRLRPLTLTTPKQMLPVVDRPMIEWVVGHLVDHGIEDVVLSLGYRPDVFRAAYPDGRCAGAELHYAVEPEPLGTAGAIRFAAVDAGIVETFVVLNGDVLTDLDVSALVRFHREHGGEATIALHEVDDPSRFGVVDLDPDGRVRRFIEKPAPGEAPSHLINAGTYVLEPSILDRVPAERAVSIEREVFPGVAADGRLWGMDDDGVYWMDTGTPDHYRQVQLDLIDGHRPFSVRSVHPDAIVDPGARVDRSVLGAEAVVRAGATVRDSVLLAGVTVADGSQVTNSVVGDRADIGAGATVDRAVVGSGVSIEAGAVVRGCSVPMVETIRA